MVWAEGFHKHGSCKFGDCCHKSHSPVSEEEKQNLKPPSRQGSPTSDKGRCKGKGQGKGKSDTSGRSSSPKAPAYCRFFLKGECKNGDKCLFAHFNQDAVDALNRVKALAKAKAKAAGKAKPKAKAQASPARMASSGSALVMPAVRPTGSEGWTTVGQRSRWSH